MSYGYCIANGLNTYGAAISALDGSGSNVALTNSSYLKDGWMAKRAGPASFTVGGANSAGLVIDFTMPVSPVGFALLNHNLASAGMTSPTLGVRAGTNNTLTAGAITAKAASPMPTVTRFKKEALLLFPATAAKQFWEIEFGCTGSTAISNIYVGEIFALFSVTTLSRGSIYGSSSSIDAVTAAVTLQYGEPRNIFLGGPVREENYRFADWKSTQVEEMIALYEGTQGFSSPFLWCENVNSTSSAATTAEQACIFGNGMLDQLDWTQDDYNVYQLPTLKIRQTGREAGA